MVFRGASDGWYHPRPGVAASTALVEERDGEGLGPRRASRAVQDIGDLRAERVERGQRSSRVDWTKRGRQREREQVERRVRGRSEVLESRATAPIGVFLASALATSNVNISFLR
jgi:hypothetical protein